MAFLDELRHAFAVEPIGAVEPTDAQRKLIDQLCREIARRRLTAPAILYLEMSRPLGFVTAQAIHFFSPIISVMSCVSRTSSGFCHTSFERSRCRRQ